MIPVITEGQQKQITISSFQNKIRVGEVIPQLREPAVRAENVGSLLSTPIRQLAIMTPRALVPSGL